MRANALAVFPGGFGTLDELFEILTLIQTRKAPPVPVVLFGRDYWRKVINFDTLVEHEVISPDDLKLFDIVDTAEEAWETMIVRRRCTPKRDSMRTVSSTRFSRCLHPAMRRNYSRRKSHLLPRARNVDGKSRR